jgi:hypothetical protein
MTPMAKPRQYETIKEARARTRRSQSWLYERIASGLLTRYPRKGRRGCTVLLDVAEVDLLIAGDLAELRHYQARQRAGARR